jgi:predicted TIM-barrel fold metal-dependent hydrolase
LFVNVDFNSVDVENHVENQVNIIRGAVAKGAIGLKVYKGLGLTNKDSKGNRVAVDDKRLGPVWEVCGELGIPVLIHSADPFQFWQDKDGQNERWFELKEKPGRYYGDSNFIPPFEEIINEQHTIFKRHPNTTFINAHLGWMGNDLDKLGKHLDEFPNVMTEFGAVIAELGRQPKTARDFFIKYQDRILFGKDSYNKEEFYTYFRVLESDDEYFNYFRKRHAFWKMYGLNLPDEVLKKIYHENALKLFPSIDKTLFE